MPRRPRAWKVRATVAKNTTSFASGSTGEPASRATAAFGTPASDLEKLALAEPKVQSFVNGKQVVKIVVVPDKLVNVVV